jgi:hypothetical protein
MVLPGGPIVYIVQLAPGAGAETQVRDIDV